MELEVEVEIPTIDRNKRGEGENFEHYLRRWVSRFNIEDQKDIGEGRNNF